MLLSKFWFNNRPWNFSWMNIYFFQLSLSWSDLQEVLQPDCFSRCNAGHPSLAPGDVYFLSLMHSDLKRQHCQRAVTLSATCMQTRARCLSVNKTRICIRRCITCNVLLCLASSSSSASMYISMETAPERTGAESEFSPADDFMFCRFLCHARWNAP